MQSDYLYQYSCGRNVRTLSEAVGGDWGSIPSNYLDHFNHSYSDGDISLIPAIGKLENTDFLEIWELDEVVEVLSKVDPSEWPSIDHIESIDAPSLLHGEGSSDGTLGNLQEFVEDNLGTSEKVQRALKATIESVFGDKIDNIRGRNGDFPSPKNHFLLEKDGTFAGTFKFQDFVFDFEIAPTEKGWLCTYRLNEKGLERLEKPEFKGKDDRKINRRKVRVRGWG